MEYVISSGLLLNTWNPTKNPHGQIGKKGTANFFALCNFILIPCLAMIKNEYNSHMDRNNKQSKMKIFMLLLWIKHPWTSDHGKYHTDAEVRSRRFKQGYEKTETISLFHTVQVMPVYF